MSVVGTVIGVAALVVSLVAICVVAGRVIAAAVEYLMDVEDCL